MPPCGSDFTTRGQRSVSKIFFGERRPTLALADMLALEGMIGSYAAAARKVDGAAAKAFIP
jgi:tryptophan-rich sensory protein